MTTTDLPAHLAGRQQRQLADAAFAGMAGTLPPHVSIRANRFTLVGADGARQTLEMAYLHCCFVDVSEAIGKLYYKFEFQDGSDDPPTCWSSNGVVPSREATERQSRTCAECQWNVRGSATSKLSGKPIKACRDEKWTALSLISASMQPLYPQVLWQLRITPGSFKNWRGFVERCQSQGVDMSLLVTRIGFEPNKNGVLTFQPVGWIDAAMADIRDHAWAANATDALVGRNEQPALEVPVQGPLLAHDNARAFAPSADLQLMPTAPAPTQTAQPAPAVSPSNPARRPRRTKAEMAASDGAAQGTAPVAPFRPQASPPVAFPAAPAAHGPKAQPALNFGIQEGAAPPAGLDAALDDFFGSVK